MTGVSVGHPVSKTEIKTVVRQLKDSMAVLANADPEDEQATYAELGVTPHLPPRRAHSSRRRRRCTRGGVVLRIELVRGAP